MDNKGLGVFVDDLVESEAMNRKLYRSMVRLRAVASGGNAGDGAVEEETTFS